MASYDEALQKMYSDRLTRFYRNYDEAKVASVPKPCGNQSKSTSGPRERTRVTTRAVGAGRGDGVRDSPRRRLDVVGVRMTERRRERERSEQP